MSVFVSKHRKAAVTLSIFPVGSGFCLETEIKNPPVNIRQVLFQDKRLLGIQTTLWEHDSLTPTQVVRRAASVVQSLSFLRVKVSPGSGTTPAPWRRSPLTETSGRPAPSPDRPPVASEGKGKDQDPSRTRTRTIQPNADTQHPALEQSFSHILHPPSTIPHFTTSLVPSIPHFTTSLVLPHPNTTNYNFTP